MPGLVDEIADALVDAATTVRRHHASPVVPVADNYDRLGIEADVTTRDARCTRYLTTDLMLRSHISSMLPGSLDDLAVSGEADVTILCPSIVYRRDVIDRHHVGEPHQLDVWRSVRVRVVT